MTYQELIDNLKDLGFANESEITEFAEQGILYTAIERATTQINTSVPGSAPRNEQYDFSVEENDTEIIRINMEEEDDTFIDFAETAMLYQKHGSDSYVRFTDYDIMNESTVELDPSGYYGDFRILYKVMHEPFKGTASQLREDLPLARRVHFLVPLLAAYYLWLEDEPAKAALYYNRYLEAKEDMLDSTAKIRGRILPGGI